MAALKERMPYYLRKVEMKKEQEKFAEEEMRKVLEGGVKEESRVVLESK